MLIRRLVNYSASLFIRRKNISRHILEKYFMIKENLPKKTFTGLLLASATLSLKSYSSNSAIIKEADTLYDEGQFEKLYSVLDTHRRSSDPELLWRLARAIFEKCRTLKDDKDKLLHYEEALRVVEEALEIDEKCWAAHKWKAILLDYVWRYKSTKERIVHSFDIRKHMERAVELNPSDATSYYLIGEWCFTFADMPWIQRKVAAAIFASPPTSTYEEALSYFEKAEKVSPQFYSMNLLMMGKCYLRINDVDKANTFLTQAKNYPIKTADDQEAHNEAVKLLKDLKV